jgi:hypothetical protein
MLAFSRLMLDNVPNIKAYWIMMGMPLAAVALHFGANDVQGTVVREEVFQAAGASAGTEQKVEEILFTLGAYVLSNDVPVTANVSIPAFVLWGGICVFAGGLFLHRRRR